MKVARPRTTIAIRFVIQSEFPVSSISIRLPKEIEQQLNEEARFSDRNRSELVREAVGEYLTRRQKERLIAEMKNAARALYADPETAAEAHRIQQDFDAVDTTEQQIETEERAAGIDPTEKWWD